jgi:ABC-2 type transport system permease protein
MTAPTIVRLELRQLLRAPAVIGGVALLCGASCAALYHGSTVIARQQVAIAASPALEREQHRAILHLLPKDANAGDQLYYLFFHTVHEPSEWASISLGQRDVQPFNLKIRLLALQGQLHDSDIASPLLAAFGSFDLAFVIVYVVPLFVIALTHNVWSSERELGTWSLVRSQPVSGPALLALKLSVRTSVVLAPMWLVILGMTWALRLPPDGRLLSVVLLTGLYVLLWVSASIVVAAWRRSSDFNLIMLLSLWIAGCILGPALVNAIAAARYPTPEALELTVRQRQGYHGAWDRPVVDTMSQFYERYPEWRGAFVPEDRYSNAWYYAMQQRGDDEARPAVEGYYDTLARRSQWVRQALVLFPPALLQSALNQLARTDLDSHLAYLASVADYHEALKRFFFPAIFDDATIQDVEWQRVPRHQFRDGRPPTWDQLDAAVLTGLTALSVAVGAALLWRGDRTSPGQ